MKKKIFPMLLGALLLPWGSITASAEDISTDSVYVGEWVTPEGEYTYPVTPDDEVWASMNYAEMRDACNMPQELVDMLSTEELVNAALDYPLMLDCLLFDSYEKGIEHLILNSNVYCELFEREDAAVVLLKAYSDLNVDYDLLTIVDPSRNLYAESNYEKEIMLQILLSTDEIFEMLNQTQTEQLIELLSEKYDEKRGKCDDFQSSMIFYAVLAENSENISRNLIPENIYEDISVDTKAASGFTKTSSTTVWRYPWAYYYEGIYSWSNGVETECYMYSSGDFSPTEASAQHTSINSAHPGWALLSQATKKYNCHSYCWIDKSENNKYWLDDPLAIASSSLYSNYGANGAISSSNSYIIIYDASGPAHSACSTTTSQGSNMTSYMTTTRVVSKLGACGVYQTTLYDMYNLYDGKYYISYTKK